MGDLSKGLQLFEATVVPKIFVVSKFGESFGITCPPSSLGATVIEKLLEVEKLLGYKPDPVMGKYFVRFMQRYMKESTTILRNILWHGIKGCRIRAFE